MNLALTDVVVVITVAVFLGIAFTIWKFRVPPTHDDASTKRLQHFFDGKRCAICKQPIPPVHRMGSKPGFFNPATKEIRSWVDIPDAELSKALETELPVCFECEVAESFRQRFPDLVTDNERTAPDADAEDRVKATGS